jgi:methionine synthase II (cobalamin-independent)
VSRWAGNVDSERMQARETADANGIYAEANRIASEFPELAADFGKAWLRSEYQDNPALREAWDNRYDSQEAMAHARKMVDRALQQFSAHARREAQRIRDIPLIADREAVSAAVRGASKSTPPPPPPRIGQMDDKTYSEYVEKNFGYRPMAGMNR